MIDFLEVDKKNIWHPFTPLEGGSEQILIESAKGIYLNTADGRKIMDAISSWWVNLHGHSHPAIAKAVAEQAQNLEHVIFAGFSHKPAIKLSENLLSILLSMNKIFFSDNGSTAVEVALKIGMQYWHNQGIIKKKIIAIEGAYHGDTFGAMSIAERSIFSAPFNQYLFDVEFIQFPTAQNSDSIIEQFKLLVQSGDVGIFIYEPLVQGASGMRIYPASTLEFLLKIAKENSVICIADEVFTGFGRTGKFFASDHISIKPDVIALSKGLTGGTVPMGVTAVSNKVLAPFKSADLLKTFFHGHSFTANPIACAASNASFELLISEQCQRSIEMITVQHNKFVKEFKENELVKEVRSLGTILAIELQSDFTSYTNNLRTKIYKYFIEQDILLRPLGNIFYVVPPYCITKTELEKIYFTIHTFLTTLE